jgi:hypothetical protein
MRKRNAGRVGSKATAARKRDAVKDLSARSGGVVGGFLPAAGATKLAAADATTVRGQMATDTCVVWYGKIE